jgi:hypothetical protein
MTDRDRCIVMTSSIFVSQEEKVRLLIFKTILKLGDEAKLFQGRYELYMIRWLLSFLYAIPSIQFRHNVCKDTSMYITV